MWRGLARVGAASGRGLQKRTSLLAPAAAMLNHTKMHSTFTMRAAVMSSHMNITVLFSVKGTATVVVSPCSATLWAFVTNGSGVAPRYTNITSAVMLPVTRAASMAGGTVVVVFVSQLFCVVTILTGVGCLQLSQVVSAWQRRSIQTRNAGFNLKQYLITGTALIKSTHVHKSEKVNEAHTFQGGGGDARTAAISAIFRKTF
eukprot:TRINITY_DN36914_c0_g1_i1.p1 TRINITY_DN36914_c0_g1~~TRINITY_DN36914_c0_g1_i1.p1  ORF type:complete len:202 (+),score=37.43 TRINITY_DN36914_c0_g1_i1:46-651(+)